MFYHVYVEDKIMGEIIMGSFDTLPKAQAELKKWKIAGLRAEIRSPWSFFDEAPDPDTTLVLK